MSTLPIRSPVPELREIADQTALRSIDQQIGQELRALYDEVLAEPIPHRLLVLVDQLDSLEANVVETEAEIIT